jgi:nucleotide-binding universal stress UspA family protein
MAWGGEEMKILIALDATAKCRKIVREAAARPWPEASRFLLFHVLDPFPHAKKPIALERAKDVARAQLKNAAQELTKAGFNSETHIVLERARQVVSITAEDWKADFVLVGSNEGGALLRLLLGSTARSVVQQVPCTVEIVRPLAESTKVGRQRFSRTSRIRSLDRWKCVGICSAARALLGGSHSWAICSE